MDNILMTILGIFLAAILIFVFPLMAVTERNDNIAQTVVETATIEFVDKISISGVIKPADYEEYRQKLESTGNTFDVQIEVQHLDENFGKKNGTTSQDLIGENERYSTFTTEILENMYLSNGTVQNYMLKKGDNVIVTAKNTNKTMAQILRTFVNKVTGKGTYEVAATSSSMVVNNGGKVQLGDSGYEPDNVGTEIDYSKVIQIKAVAEFDDNSRPEKVIATLYKEVNGQITIDNKELNASNNWQYTWNINEYENYNIVKYTIEGHEVEGYEYFGSVAINDTTYLSYKHKPKVNRWVQNGTTITGETEDGEILVTLQIGDYINYDCTNGGNTYSYTSPGNQNGYGNQTFTTRNGLDWRVIGVENNNLIISATIPGFKLQFKENNNINEINNVAKIFDNGYGAVQNGARSINKDDIISLFNAFGIYSNRLNEYGNGTEIFRIYLTDKSSFSVNTNYAGAIKFTNANSKLLDLIFPTKVTSDFYKTGYWIANTYTFMYNNFNHYGIYGTWLDESGEAIIYAYHLYNASDWPNGRALNVRPVVTLETEIELESAGKYNDCNKWNIKNDQKDYKTGQEITLKGENFYVIGQNTETVTLLAKYNLKEDGSAQDTTGEINYCRFSAVGGFTAGEDLNRNTRIKADTTSAVYKAMEYGKKIGADVNGRLMTYEEALQLSESEDENIIKILYGGYSEGEYLDYWLGSAFDTSFVWYVYAGNHYAFYSDPYYDDFVGVRPVIEILKSAI